MNNITFNTEGLEVEFIAAERLLFNPQNIYQIIYHEFNFKTFKEKNKEFLKTIKNKSLVYCIWISESNDQMIVKYIGHVKAKDSETRITNHLGVDYKTVGSKIKYVKKELSLKKRIGISVLSIAPEYLRTSLEEWLITKNSAILQWNKAGKKNRIK